MPTDVKRRGGNYPVRLSLNIAESTSQLLDRWELRTGRSRGELAREALELGVPKLSQRLRKSVSRQRARADRDDPGSDGDGLDPSLPEQADVPA